MVGVVVFIDVVLAVVEVVMVVGGRVVVLVCSGVTSDGTLAKC